MGSHAEETIDQNVIDVTGASGYEQVLDIAFPNGADASESDVLIWSDTNHATSTDKIGDLFSIERIAELSKRGVTDIYIEKLEVSQPLVAKLIADQDVDAFVAEYDRIATPLAASQEDFLSQARDTAHMIVVAAEMKPPINVHMVQIAYTPEQEQDLGEFEERMFAIQDDAFVTLSDLATEFSKYTELSDSDEQLLLDGHITEYIVDDRAVFNLNIIKEQFRDRVPDDVLDDTVIKLRDFKNRHLEISSQYNRLADQFRVDNDVILAERIADSLPQDGKAVLVHGSAHGSNRSGIDGVDIDELLLQNGLSSTRVNLAYDRWGLLSSQYSTDPTELTYYPQEDRFTIDDLDDGNPEILGFEGVDPTPRRLTP